MFYRALDRLGKTWTILNGRAKALQWRLRGARVGAKTSVGPRTQILSPWQFRCGKRCVIEPDVTIRLVSERALVAMGDSAYVGRFAIFDISESCEIGQHVLIAAGVMIVDHNHGLALGAFIDEQPCIGKKICIGSDVWIGAYSVILPGVSIGAGAVIGANSCVTKDIPANSIAVGVPARVIGHRTFEAERQGPEKSTET